MRAHSFNMTQYNCTIVFLKVGFVQHSNLVTICYFLYHLKKKEMRRYVQIKNRGNGRDFS